MICKSLIFDFVILKRVPFIINLLLVFTGVPYIKMLSDANYNTIDVGDGQADTSFVIELSKWKLEMMEILPSKNSETFFISSIWKYLLLACWSCNNRAAIEEVLDNIFNIWNVVSAYFIEIDMAVCSDVHYRISFDSIDVSSQV